MRVELQGLFQCRRMVRNVAGNEYGNKRLMTRFYCAVQLKTALIFTATGLVVTHANRAAACVCKSSDCV